MGKPATNEEVMSLLNRCCESTAKINSDLGLLAVKDFIDYNEILEKNASNEFEKMIIRMMSESIIVSDQFSPLKKRLNLNERNEKSFKKNGNKKKVIPKNPSKTPDHPPLEKVNIPSDLDERIEKYLSTKK